MEIQTQLETKDFKAFIAFNQRRLQLATEKRDSWAFALLGLFLGGVLALGGPLGLFPFHAPSAGVAFLAAFLIFFTIFYRMIRRWQERLIPKDESCRLGPHTYRISPDGFFDISPRMETYLRWSAVSSLQETARYFFVIIDSGSGYILPKRFISHEDQEKFRREILAFLMV